jgi:hypothetical protein
MLNSNGQAKGVFSGDSARRFTDRYAAVLPPDTLWKYRGTILGPQPGRRLFVRQLLGRQDDHPGAGRRLHGVASARHLHLSTTLKAGCIFFLLFGIAFLRRRRSDL